MTTDIQSYFTDGCGRCNFSGTPNCKVITWSKEMLLLREILNSCGMVETMKWGSPVYMVGTTNTIMLAAFKGFASINFFKGVLLQDEAQQLVFAGDNSQSAKQWRFTSLNEIIEQKDLIKAYIFEAIELERIGAQVEKPASKDIELPEELLAAFEKNPQLKLAFEKLTPGRQRSHVIFISGAKQSATRASRVEKNSPKILAGKGMHD